MSPFSFYYDRKTDTDKSLGRSLKDLEKLVASYIPKLFTKCCEIRVHALFYIAHTYDKAAQGQVTLTYLESCCSLVNVS